MTHPSFAKLPEDPAAKLGDAKRPRMIIWYDAVPDYLADLGVACVGVNGQGDIVGVVLQTIDRKPSVHLLVWQAEAKLGNGKTRPGRWLDSRNSREQASIRYTLHPSQWPHGVTVTNPDVQQWLKEPNRNGVRPAHSRVHKGVDAVVTSYFRLFTLTDAA